MNANEMERTKGLNSRAWYVPSCLFRSKSCFFEARVPHVQQLHKIDPPTTMRSLARTSLVGAVAFDTSNTRGALHVDVFRLPVMLLGVLSKLQRLFRFLALDAVNCLD